MARVRGFVGTAAAAVAAAAVATIAATATSAAAAAACTRRTVGGSVAVEAESGFRIGAGWVDTTFGGARGVVWKPWKADRSVDGPGQGVRWYTVRITEGGHYRLLLRASGAAVRDHNDFFVKLGYGSRRVYPNGHDVGVPDGWVKVYQNHGRGEWAWGAVEFGGAPVTRWLPPGSFSFAVAGRSSKAAIDKLVLYKCALGDRSCIDRSGAYWAAIKAAWQPPQCWGTGGGGGGGERRAPPPAAPKTRPAPKQPAAPTRPRRPEGPRPAPGGGGGGGGGRCGVYSSAGGVVRMPVAAAGGGGGWAVANRGSRWALVFKPNKRSHSVDAPGQGIKHYKFRAAVAGTYRLALRMAAPHPTEHNDVWVKLGHGARKMKGRSVVGLSGGFVKVYENDGGMKWMVGGKTKDFDGHDLLTRHLYAGEVFDVTLSGRSSLLALADILLWACDPYRGQCNDGSPGYKHVSGMGPSGCA